MKSRNYNNSNMYTICCANMNNHRINKNKKIIYVEGKNDQAIFENITNNGWIIIPITNTEGKKDILKNIKDSNNSDIIGIVDKDYDNNEVINNIFFTDYNDIECTAINYMSNDEIKASSGIYNYNMSDFINKVLDPVKNVSCEFSNLWRWSNQEILDEKKRLKYLFNYDNWYAYLKRSLNDNSTINYKSLEKIYVDLGYHNNIDYMGIMKNSINNKEFRGHDFFHILFYTLKEKKISCLYLDKPSTLETKFIEKSSKYEWIKRTNVYNDIKKSVGCFR